MAQQAQQAQQAQTRYVLLISAFFDTENSTVIIATGNDALKYMPAAAPATSDKESSYAPIRCTQNSASTDTTSAVEKKCQFCGATFMRYRNLAMHINSEHKDIIP